VFNDIVNVSSHVNPHRFYNILNSSPDPFRKNPLYLWVLTFQN